jgi:ATP-dependent DNA helicase RecG
MANPFDTLRGMLKNEISRGYDNQIVRGGLDKYSPAFEQQARKANFDEALIAETLAWLKSYGGLTPEQRAEAIKEFLPKLPTALPKPAIASAPPPVNRPTPPPPQPKPTPAPQRPPPPQPKPTPAPQRPPPPQPKPTPAPQRPPTPPPPPKPVEQRKTEITQEVAAAPTVTEVREEKAPPPPVPASPSQPVSAPRVERPQSHQPSQPTPSSAPRPVTRPFTPKPRPPAPAQRKTLPPEPAGVGPDAPLTVLRGIGPKQAENLQRLGLRTMGDTLYFFPRRYVDYSAIKTINQLEFGQEVTVLAVVWEAYNKRIQGGRSSMLKCILRDGTGTIEAPWFNQPWLVNKLTQGRQVQVAGRVDEYLGRLTLKNAVLEDLDREALGTGRIVPIYPLTKDVSATALRRWMYEAVGYTAPKVVDPLPESIRTRINLLPLSEALLQIHFPDSQEKLAAARKRLAFDEMLLLQLGVQRQRQEWKSEIGQALRVFDEKLNALIATLPYELTGAQKRAVADIRADLAKPVPMNRLLQGDVGSGKTVVAALAMAVAVGAGAQAAIMAPTAILAEQHYRNISKLLGEDISTALLLGATPDSEKQRIYDGLRDGSIKIVIGTQALIQEKVEFANLGLVVMDEQHRFGVAQRAKLRSKGTAGAPHVLVMTATPIPRTLALTVYGELELSIIDEMPPGRVPIVTRIMYVNERERAYAFLRAQIQQGRQAYIICPLVEESDKIEAKAAVEEYERLQTQIFPDLKLGLLHGRMKPAEKEEVMTRFRDGDVQVLVSTSVVEVGVDVPNASTVLVEGANRFGLSQLHQFRGRVGRGTHQSYCLLASDFGEKDKNGQIANARLAAMEQTQNGFVLAEKDLEIRGPGEFLGTRQSGFGDLKLAKLTDLPLIGLARQEALALLQTDPGLSQPQHGLLAERLTDFWRNIQGAGDVS